MPLKEWRTNKNICAYPSSSKDFNFNTLTNNEVISTCHDYNILIWLDTSLNKEDPDDQNSINQLRHVINSAVIFTDEQECLKFINKFKTKNKLFLIVSGSLGQSFVPKIDHLSQIYSIYVFCGRKINHESWAKQYEKVKGVFDIITDLCENLKRDKQNLEADRLFQTFIDTLPKQSLTLDELNNDINFKNSKYEHHQVKDDIKIIVTSTDTPFSKERSCSPKKEMETSNNIHVSKTVTPVVQYKQEMEFSDTGIWPCISVIDSARNEVFNCLHSVLGIVQFFNSVENCLQHIHNHRDDPQLIVLCNPIDIEHLFTLIHLHVRKVYIYCSTNLINGYYALSNRYPTIVSVLQHIDTLTRLILWDLSACIMDIGNYYDSENKKNLAQTRYRYAYRLHLTIHGDLNSRIEMISILDE